MSETIRDLYNKKILAAGTTESEIDKLNLNIERKQRIIAKARLEIEAQEAAISDKESKRAEFEAKAQFQRERAESISRYLDEATRLRKDLDDVTDEIERLKDWGSDVVRMKAITSDPNSAYNRARERSDKIYSEIRRLTDFAHAEYNKPWIR